MNHDISVIKRRSGRKMSFAKTISIVPLRPSQSARVRTPTFVEWRDLIGPLKFPFSHLKIEIAQSGGHRELGRVERERVKRKRN